MTLQCKSVGKYDICLSSHIVSCFWVSDQSMEQKERHKAIEQQIQGQKKMCMPIATAPPWAFTLHRRQQMNRFASQVNTTGFRVQ